MGKRAATSLKAQKEFRWTWVKYGIAIAIIALASFLLYRTLSGYSLNDIVQSIKAIPPSRLLLAGLFAAGSYFCLSWFDWRCGMWTSPCPTAMRRLRRFAVSRSVTISASQP